MIIVIEISVLWSLLQAFILVYLFIKFKQNDTPSIDYKIKLFMAELIYKFHFLYEDNWGCGFRLAGYP